MAAPELIPLSEAARRFGIGRHQLNVWIRTGKIPADLVRQLTNHSRYIVWDPSRLPGVPPPDTMPEPPTGGDE